jgi:hypothetical protein
MNLPLPEYARRQIAHSGASRKVARTIADLDGVESVAAKHVA